MVRAVVDTNVLFTGITAPDRDAGGVLAAWLTERFRACVSTALAPGYAEVLTHKLTAERARVALGLLRELLRRCEYTDIRVAVRPLSPDPDDDFVIDCAFNASACIVTENTRDFREAGAVCGIAVYTAAEFLEQLEGEK